MRFPFMVTRYFTTVPAGEVTLGSDTLPNSFSGEPGNYASLNAKKSNVFSCRLANINGWPVQRIVVGYKYEGAGSPPATLPVTVWVLDETSRNWYQVAGPATLLQNQLVFFDHPILSDNQQTQGNTADAVVKREVGSLDVALVIGSAGAVDGRYLFPVGADVSSDVPTSTGGAEPVIEQQAPGYEDGTANRALVEQRNAFVNITTATTTVVKSGPGFLHMLVINTPVASATITIYDNTAASGTKIATITIPSTVTGEAPSSIEYDVAFSTGLTIVTSGATDITVAYR